MAPLTLTILAGLMIASSATFAGSQIRPSLRMPALFLLVCSLGALCFAAFEIDQITGASASWIFCGSLISIGAALSLRRFIRYQSWVALIAAAAFVAAILALHFWDLTPIKPHNRLQNALRVGMTRAEVHTALAREFPVRGRFRAPSLFVDRVPMVGDGEMIISGNLNSGNILLLFHDGRMIGDHPSIALTKIEQFYNVVIGMMALLAICLCAVEWLRSRGILAQDQIGHGIEVRTVIETVQNLQHNSGRHQRSQKEICARRLQLTSARKALSRFSYFRTAKDSRATPEEPEPDQ